MRITELSYGIMRDISNMKLKFQTQCKRCKWLGKKDTTFSSFNPLKEYCDNCQEELRNIHKKEKEEKENAKQTKKNTDSEKNTSDTDRI